MLDSLVLISKLSTNASSGQEVNDRNHHQHGLCSHPAAGGWFQSPHNTAPWPRLYWANTPSPKTDPSHPDHTSIAGRRAITTAFMALFGPKLPAVASRTGIAFN
jgi:hypothetical protein